MKQVDETLQEQKNEINILNILMNDFEYAGIESKNQPAKKKSKKHCILLKC